MTSIHRMIDNQPPLPLPPPRPQRNTNNKRIATSSVSGDSDDIVKDFDSSGGAKQTPQSGQLRKKKSHKTKRAPPIPLPNGYKASDLYNISKAQRNSQRSSTSQPDLQSAYQANEQFGGDILTRVAIPRSGSFLNTTGLARYKATRRAAGKPGGGGG